MTMRTHSITISDLISEYKRLKNIFTKKEKVLLRILHFWEQGRAVDLPFDHVKDLFIRVNEIETQLKTALRTLKENFWEGIYVIRALRRKYGTSKTQIAKFLHNELVKLGIDILRYMNIDRSKDLTRLGNNIISILEQASSGTRIVIFIDEIDLLVDPSLPEQEQTKVIEEFANIIIGASEKAFNEGKHLVLILVMSHKVDDLINNVSRDRLGRRLTNTLIDADIMLESSDILELSIKVGLAILLRSIIKNEKITVIERDDILFQKFMNLLYQLIMSLYRDLWDEAEIRNLTIGDAVTTLVRIFKSFIEGIDWDNFAPKYDILHGDQSALGGKLEILIKDYLANIVGSKQFQKDSYKVKIVFRNKEYNVDGHECDAYYEFFIGEQQEVGKMLIEITIMEDITSKTSQLKAFSNGYPTLLVYLGASDINTIRKIDEFIDDIGAESSYPIHRIILKKDLIKFALLLKRRKQYEFISALFDISKEIEPILDKISNMFYKEWFAVYAPPPKRGISMPQWMTLPVKQETHEKRLRISPEEFKERLKSNIESAIAKLDLETKQRKTKQKIIEVLREAIERVSEKYGISIPLEPTILENVLKGIIKKWVQNNLGRETEKTFFPYNKRNRRPNPTWDNEKAANIAYQELEKVFLKELT